MRYAIFNENNEFLHLLVSGIHQIPESAFPVNDELAVKLVNEKDGLWKLTGTEIVKTPLPDVAPAIPQSVSRAQGKAALIQAGLWSDVLAYIAAIPDPTAQALAEVALSDTTEWLRDSPFLNEAAAALGLSPGDLDELFITASTIQL